MAVDNKQQMSVESTRSTIARYLGTGTRDVTALAEEIVFTVMTTGQQFHGRPAVQQQLDYLYQGVFDAHPELTNLVIAPGQGVVEALVVGTHIGEFAGVPATGKAIRVPFCLVF